MFGVPDDKIGEYTVKALCLGVPGTGKSTLLRAVATTHFKSGGRTLIIPSSPDEETFNDVPLLTDPLKINTFKGIHRMYCADSDEFGYVAEHLKDCMIICDDFRGYMPSSNLSKEVRQMFLSARHRGVHIYMAAHGFTQVAPELLDYANLVILWKTTGNPERQAGKFLDMDKLLEFQARVNREAEKDIYYYDFFEK